MQNSKSIPVVTGVGICSAVGCGKHAFIEAMRKGSTNFNVMKRQGRQNQSFFIGAEVDSSLLSESVQQNKLIRNNSLTVNAAIYSLHEAWQEANLDDECDPLRVGVIVGGSNLQQREYILLRERLSNPAYTSPRYATSFMDTDISACLSELLGVHGFAYSIGGASASGNLALIHAAKAISERAADVVVCIGALCDLSWVELHSFCNLGAMGGLGFEDNPTQACRPFDEHSRGFIYGEACGAIIVESTEHAAKREQQILGEIHGWAHFVDANRGPNANIAGETKVIESALQQASWKADQVDYVNPHGSGSPSGDNIELQALSQAQLNHAWINTTKSLTGHSLSAAGCIESIATILQMQEKFLHPSINLETPRSNDFNWVKQTQPYQIQRAINLSYGFGGINTAVCLAYPQ